MGERLAHEAWQGSTSGTVWMHRALIRSLRFMNLRVVYLGMAVFVIPFYMLFARRGYLAMYHYFRRRHGFGVWKSFRYVWLNHYRFGQVVLDRFAAYAGQRFELERDGGSLFDELCSQPGGFIILSCHVGNYEMVGYTFTADKKRYNALVYSGEAATVTEQRNRILSKHNIRLIPVKEDMSHIFVMNEALADGEIVSIPADRIFGSSRYVETELLGGRVRLPMGPFATALQRGVPTICMFAMKVSAYRYKVIIREVNEKGIVNSEKGREEKIAGLARSFTREMETVLKAYPEQWYNYFEYWEN